MKEREWKWKAAKDRKIKGEKEDRKKNSPGKGCMQKGRMKTQSINSNPSGKIFPTLSQFLFPPFAQPLINVFYFIGAFIS